MSFVETATNKISLVGLAVVGSALVVGLFGVGHVVVAGGALAGVGYLVTAYKHSDVPGGTPVA